MKTTLFKSLTFVLVSVFLLTACSKKEQESPINKYRISIVADPAEGGTVSRSEEGPSYAEGTTVTLEAVANNGYEFVKWKGDLSGNKNPTTLKMDKSKQITAVFREEDRLAIVASQDELYQGDSVAFTVLFGEDTVAADIYINGEKIDRNIKKFDSSGTFSAQAKKENYSNSANININVKQFDGSENAVDAFVGASLLDTMKGLGLVVHPGKQPPNVEGEYKFAPIILKSSNVPGESPGKDFLDMDFSYTNQNNSNHTILYSYDESGVESGTALGSIISGSGNGFTIFLKIVVEIDGYKADVIQILSGTKVDGGFEDYQWANFMVDDRGSPKGIFLKNGEGRLLIDADGFVKKK